MPSAEPRWPIRSVVFDLDGLLIDSEPIFREAAYRFLARRNLVPCNEILDAMMGRPGAQALEMFRQHHGLTDSIGELAQECSQLFYEVLGHNPVRLMPGAVALLERLERKKVPKAMATSSRRPYVERILKPHGLLHRFDFVLTGDDVRAGKPDPEVYLKAASQFGHPATELLVLEDSPNGLRAAKAAGARCIAVPHALIPRHDLAGADAVVESLEHPRLLELLGL